MRTVALAGFVVVVLSAPAGAQEAPAVPTPTKEHEWLKQLVGEWETEAEMVVEPGKPPVKSKGTETVRLLGGFWLVSEMHGDCLGVPVTGIMTVGYDPQKKKYVGTFVCSMCDLLFKYEGTVNGKVLTLECDGPSPTDPTKTVRMRDVLELKDKDTRTLTSSLLGEDGKWVVFMTATAKRKK
jgi:hypothetical protein